MVQLQTIPLKETIAFLANSTKGIDIPRNRFIRQIQMRAQIKIVNPGSGTTVLEENNPLGVIKRIRLTVNGKDTKIDIPGTELFYYLKYRNGVEPERSQHSVTNSATTIGIAELTLDFAQIEKDLEDITALLPAADYTSCRLEVDWGDVDDLQTSVPGTITVADSKIDVTVVEAVLTDEDIAKLTEIFGSAKVLDKTISTEVHSITAISNNYAFSKDIKPGELIAATLLKARDNSLRNDDLITSFKFKQYSPVKGDIEERRWYESQAKDKRKYQLESVVRGVTLIDWSEKGVLDLRDLKTGDIKVETIHIAPTGTADLTVVQVAFS